MVKAQNEKYQQRLKDLETRINTIQALQNSRVGPRRVDERAGEHRQQDQRYLSLHHDPHGRTA